MKVVVNVKLKNGVLDPQGKAVENALISLGFKDVDNVRIAKQIVFNINKDDKDEVKNDVVEMCEKLLANTVIEEYEIVL
ncbi:phosphoribosylformylglycinamidine synthase subunit PurS [Campylobacter sp. FMV-PI01]|uniref:Phosphoribosylformylglycinamidine synthase subunit PurS n=1 Tax=Campylobacter portucalensis TaxID=2608384 RepID=A0A6L5WL46_9BACT|nr:phosphoribosylformylglycinamidine synthase subunit PurS [Campylobacter portucalensis]MSN96997.1 phosphoribosylformylglycinamidine synthase subunit PurS [Campylobacter portucalensis]